MEEFDCCDVLRWRTVHTLLYVTGCPYIALAQIIHYHTGKLSFLVTRCTQIDLARRLHGIQRILQQTATATAPLPASASVIAFVSVPASASAPDSFSPPQLLNQDGRETRSPIQISSRLPQLTLHSANMKMNYLLAPQNQIMPAGATTAFIPQ